MLPRPLLALPLALVLLTCASRPTPSGDPSPAPPRPSTSRWDHDWTRGAVFYEVFVRSFRDSDGDGKGDLRGLIERLDYVNDGDPSTTTDLGVDALWLMPVFASPSYHGYDTIDYETINPDYGTNSDFARLCDEAYRRGIRVIVDLVVNHTGSGHPWFTESASSPTSSLRSWYVWSPTDLGWRQPWGGSTGTWHPRNGAYYYGVFWSGMPDLNLTTPAVREQVKRIAALWLSRGADGFRLDASRYAIETGAGAGQADTAETHAFWKELAAYVRAARPDAALVAENWTDTPVVATYYGSTATVPGGDELPMNFNFPLADALLRGVDGGSATPVAAKLDEMRRVYPPGVNDAPFLTNHDQVRLATQLGKSGGKLRNAAALLLTLPGAPFVYYGEELGIENGPASGDEAKRTPMPWDDASPGGGFTSGTPWYAFAPGRSTANVAAQAADPGSLLTRYRELIRTRKGSAALSKGTLELLTPAAGATNVLAFTRSEGEETVLVAHNLSDTFASAGPLDAPGSAAEPLFADVGASASGSPGAWRASLPPRATGIWRLR